MKKLLVVEDDIFIVRAYQAKLAKSDLEVKVVTDGLQAMEVLPIFRPDIILLDLVMPRKDGFTFLQEIKESPEFKNIPVIVASNLAQKNDMTKVKELGAIQYMVKSNFSLDQLIAEIHKVLKAA